MRLSEITSQTHLDLYVLLSYSSVFLPPPPKKKGLCTLFLYLPFSLSHYLS